MPKSWVGVLYAFVLVLTCWGCGGSAHTTKSLVSTGTHISSPAEIEHSKPSTAQTLTAATLPSGVVANVGGTSVSVAALNHKINVAASGDFYAAAQMSAPAGVFTQPLNLKRCASFVTATAAAHHVGITNPARLCRHLGEGVEQQALAGIISYYWLVGQAREVGAVANQEEVESEFAKWKAERFHSEAELATYMQERDMTTADLLESAREEVLSSKLLKQLQALQGQGAYGRFEKRAAAEWTRKTICVPRYAAEGCRDFRADPSVPSPGELIDGIVGASKP